MIALALMVAAPTALDRCLGSGAAAQGVTSAMSACFVADYRRADDRLNDVYRSTMKRLPPLRRSALRASQRAWLGQRDHACPLDTGNGVGTIETMNHPACLTAQTKRRTTWLTRLR
ncbi:lysozyme inhibitor LprI family protein [Sphingomonas sp. CLY1604]|uniref:lysozyme inhibitor LprI family protein n=1 Tax=Sphingomonas sp. CLY1604 TaxID=3457786 RepID=UPI003FD89D5D